MLVLRRRDAAAWQALPQVQERTRIEHVAVVRALQDALGPAEVNTHACTGQRFQRRTDVAEQRLALDRVTVVTCLGQTAIAADAINRSMARRCSPQPCEQRSACQCRVRGDDT